tara:strand:- start:155 stop:838 length:684 start_codon:yes stop_codon:yes gene_type:complete
MKKKSCIIVLTAFSVLLLFNIYGLATFPYYELTNDLIKIQIKGSILGIINIIGKITISIVVLLSFKFQQNFEIKNSIKTNLHLITFLKTLACIGIVFNIIWINYYIIFSDGIQGLFLNFGNDAIVLIDQIALLTLCSIILFNPKIELNSMNFKLLIIALLGFSVSAIESIYSLGISYSYGEEILSFHTLNRFAYMLPCLSCILLSISIYLQDSKLCRIHLKEVGSSV